jgi:hypothetical protein
MFEKLFERQPTRVVTDPYAVADQLAPMGLTIDLLSSALEAGNGDAAMATGLSAASAYGFNFWNGTITHLRFSLVNDGWNVSRPNGLEVVRRDDNRMQITASLGDACVGDPSATPTPEHPRGAASQAAVLDNQATLQSLGDYHPSWEPLETWWLLYRHGGLGDTTKIVAELSLPVAMDGTRITWWQTRLILPEIELGGQGRGLTLPAVPTEIHPDVRRRAG